eukprot:403335557
MPVNFKDQVKQLQIENNQRETDNTSQIDLKGYQQIIQNQCEIIQPEKIKNFDKGIAIIYNPTSGKSKEIQKLIQEFLDKRNINHQFIATERLYHAIDLCQKELDLSKFDAIMPVGGDGTIHEVINGMLRRKDKAKLPIIMVPNGTGNDFCGTFYIDTPEQALTNLENPSKMKIDVLRALIDHENEESIPPHLQKDLHRYSIINSCISLPARAAGFAPKIKHIFGSQAYVVSTAGYILTHKPDYYDIYIDNKKYFDNLDVSCIFVNNGKLGGGRNILNSFGIINDGLTEIGIVTNMFTKYGMIRGIPIIQKFFNGATKAGGLHVYDQENYQLGRGQEIKIVNKNYLPQSLSSYSLGNQEVTKKAVSLNIDGEAFKFHEFVKYTVLHNEIEIIVDYERLLRQSKYDLTNV